MRSIVYLFTITALLSGLAACHKPDDKKVEDKPAFDLVPQREQLQKAKDLEKKMQQDAEEQRRVIELQTK